MRATDRTRGTTQAGTRQGGNRVARSSVHNGEAITPEPSTDLEVNGPRWDNHFVDMVLESDDATNSRTRVMHQANRPMGLGQSQLARPTGPSTRQQPAEPPLGSGTQSLWHEDSDQSTRTGDSSGGSTRSRSGRSRSHSTRSNHRESLDWSIYHRTSALASKCKLT